MQAHDEIYALAHRIMKATGHANAVPLLRLARLHAAALNPITWHTTRFDFKRRNPLRVRLAALWKCWKASEYATKQGE